MIHAIDVAISQLGVHEETGDNDGIPAERYMRGDELAWCAGLLLFCFDESDNPPIWDDFDPDTVNDARRYWKLRAVQSMEDWLKEVGLWFGWRMKPQTNDIIFFASRGRSDAAAGGRHVGIVESVSDTMVSTIEGNLGNEVKRAIHSLDDRRITGYGRVGNWPG